MIHDQARPLRQLLLRVRARQVRNRVVGEVSELLLVALAATLAWQAWNTLMPSRWMVGAWLPLAVLLAVVARAVVRIARPAPLWQAAADADRAASLRDELTSAWWFARHDSGSEWAGAHVERAAERASALDARALVPAAKPQRPAWLGALAMALLALWLLPVPRLFEPVIDRLAEVLPGAGEDLGPVADLPEAVAEAPEPPPAERQEMLLPDSEGGEQMPGEEGEPQEGEEGAEQEPGEEQGEPGEEGEPAEGQEGEPQDQQPPADAEGEPSPDAEASQQEGEGEATEESGAMLPGGEEVFLQESGEDMQQAEQAEEEMGHATREGGTEQQLDQGEMTTLEVQLQREMLLMPEDPPRADPEAEEEEAEKEEEITKAERSFLEFADQPATQKSAIQEVLEGEAIPWRYRQLVLDYFKALRARDNQQRDKPKQ